MKQLTKDKKNLKNTLKKNSRKFGNVNTLFFLKNNKLEANKKDFDLVLTFRNTHNWLGSNTALNVYKSIYNSMKKGAVLGIVQHRANEDIDANFKNGYVKESFLIDFIEKIGFKF